MAVFPLDLTGSASAFLAQNSSVEALPTSLKWPPGQQSIEAFKIVLKRKITSRSQQPGLLVSVLFVFSPLPPSLQLNVNSFPSIVRLEAGYCS